MIKIILKYLILGLIQGFTEPLPISSSGHIKIFRNLFNSKVLNDINFEVIVNFGSLIAIIIIYRNEIINIIKDFFKYLKTKNNIYKINFKYTLLIIIGTIPACIFGLFFKNLIEDIFTTKVIGLMFIITSLLLYIVKDKNGSKRKENITYFDAIKIGLYQALALIPGISRSGSTLVGGLNSNLSKETAINYSFMLYIPISIASFILGIKDLVKSNNIYNLLLPYLISLIMSIIATYFSTKLFINITKKGKLICFSIYCFTLGIITFLTF